MSRSPARTKKSKSKSNVKKLSQRPPCPPGCRPISPRGSPRASPRSKFTPRAKERDQVRAYLDGNPARSKQLAETGDAFTDHLIRAYNAVPGIIAEVTRRMRSRRLRAAIPDVHRRYQAAFQETLVAFEETLAETQQQIDERVAKTLLETRAIKRAVLSLLL
jgi:hypothetical protein